MNCAKIERETKGGNSMRILVVEDEERLASTMKDMLVQAKYFVDVVHDGESGLDYARSGIYDGLIFDVMLPYVDGFTAVRTLREEQITTPVLMLTARTQTSDRVDGLDAGADYYLTKPFQKEELLACIRALLRRQGDSLREELVFGDLTLDLTANTLSKAEESVPLSMRELELARLLFTYGDKVVPKETIFLKIWGYDSEAESNVVEAYASFLRRKIRHLKSSVALQAVRGKGYRLHDAESTETK